MHWVINIDLRGSSAMSAETRIAAQQKLVDASEVFVALATSGNRKLAFILPSIVQGDELQVVIPRDNPPNPFEFAWRVVEHMSPFQVTLGIGYGGIFATVNEPKFSNDYDGPAFYIARERLQFSKLTKRLGSCGTDPKLHDQAGQLAGVVSAILHGLTPWTNQFKDQNLATSVQLNQQGESQSEIANRLGIGQSSVSRRLMRFDFDEYHSLWHAVLTSASLLEEIGELENQWL